MGHKWVCPTRKHKNWVKEKAAFGYAKIRSIFRLKATSLCRRHFLKQKKKISNIWDWFFIIFSKFFGNKNILFYFFKFIWVSIWSQFFFRFYMKFFQNFLKIKIFFIISFIIFESPNEVLFSMKFFLVYLGYFVKFS